MTPFVGAVKNAMNYISRIVQSLLNASNSTQKPEMVNSTTPAVNSQPSAIPEATSDVIYSLAVTNLGKHLTLDQSVPNEVGCAEAVSNILNQAGIKGIPQRGYASTDDLCQWLKTNSQFKEMGYPVYGGVVISPTEGQNHGHTGIILKRGIASNDSSNGLFQENYTYQGWVDSFRGKGLQVYYFSPL